MSAADGVTPPKESGVPLPGISQSVKAKRERLLFDRTGRFITNRFELHHQCQALPSRTAFRFFSLCAELKASAVSSPCAVKSPSSADRSIKTKSSAALSFERRSRLPYV
jgi:hypothetical protein